MKIWLKKYWPVWLFIGPAVTFLFVRAMHLLWMYGREGIGPGIRLVPFTSFVFLILLLVWAGIGIFMIAKPLEQAYYARILLRSISSEESGHGLQALAHELHNAHDMNIRLQKGEYQFGLDTPPGDEETVAAFYASFRKKRTEQVAEEIGSLKDDFWGAARLLKDWEIHKLPKSYKDCFVKTELREDGASSDAA